MPSAPKDVTLALIDDLFDLVRRFGRVVPEGPHLFIAVIDPVPMYSVVSAIFGARQMWVMARHDEVVSTAPYVIPLDGDGNGVVWDAELSAENARACIAAVDKRLRAYKGAFLSDGRRERVPYDLSDRLFQRSVDATFTSPNVMMPIRNPALLMVYRSQFDRPEELVPFTDGFNHLYLCRAAHLDEVTHRQAALARVCARWGITRRQQLGELSPEDTVRFSTEFDKELARRPN